MPDNNATLLRTLKRFWPALRPDRAKVAMAFTMSLLASGLAVAAPLPIKLIIDEVLQGKHPVGFPAMAPQQLVVWLAIAAAGLAMLAAIASAAEKTISARLRERMTLAIRLSCLDRLMVLTPRSRGDDRSGELGLRLIDDVQQVARLFTKTMPVILRHTLTLLFTLAALFVISPVLGAGALAIALVLSAIVRVAARPLRTTARAKRQQEGRVAGLAQEILRALSFIQIAGAEHEIRSRFAAVNTDSLGAGVAEARAAVRLERTMQVANGLAVALIVGGGGWLALNGRVSAGDLAVAVLYLNQMLRPVEKINELASAVSGATSRAARLAELLDRDEGLDRSGTHAPGRARGRITLLATAFAYPDGPGIACETINIAAGDLVSLEGPSGSGKSTLLSLLTRLFDPQSGSILLDGRTYREWDLAALRQQFALSPQSPPLMAGTVGEWLCFGGIEADEPALWAALKAVSLEGVIRARGGLDAPLGEGGAGFSGGEQSRLSLARALAADRPVLLLDEPLANVDPISARIILAALAAEKGKRTFVIVSHQPLPEGLASMRLLMAGGRLSAEAEPIRAGAA
jgi:ATP-binding cassette, subfamily B, bacterial